MTPKAALCLLAVIWSVASTGPAHAQGTGLTVGWISEENSPGLCPNGYLLQGVQCAGRYCDNKLLTCSPSPWPVDRSATYSWSTWFSEESESGITPRPNPGRPTTALRTRTFVTGIACSGAYCDNVRLRLLALGPATLTCTDQHPISEERPYDAAMCPTGSYVADMRCRGSYCDNLTLVCCAETR